MNYTVLITKKAKKSLNKMNKDFKDRMNKSLKNMIYYYENKESTKPNIKSLKGKYKGLLRLKIGDYRVIYKLENNKFIILVIDVIARGNAYK